VTEADRERNKRELIAEIVKAVNAELWMNLLLAGISMPPDHWDAFDRLKMAERLRIVADELDPPEQMEAS
jgi:hypothetical protein